MCFRIIIWTAVCLIGCISCSQYRKIELVRSGGVRMTLTVPEDNQEEDCVEVNMNVDGEVEGVGAEEPFLMNAVRDEETGEMVASDVIWASSVTASFRNVAERAGYVTIGFDINVPAAMADSRFQLKLYPRMTMLDEMCELEPVVITGQKYREGQLRGYERYRRFLASIVTDTTDFVRIGQLEIFLKRHYPDTYKMKNDSSLVSDPQAENLFGVTQQEALRHYTWKLLRRVNDRRRARQEIVFRKCVKDPIINEGVRLDTVLCSAEGDFVYRYLHTFKTVPDLKKVIVSINGSLFADGTAVAVLPNADELTFYISTLSSLIDDVPKYKTLIVERKVYDNAKIYLDFRTGSSQLDTTLGNNAKELLRVKKCIEEVITKDEYVLDSLLVIASCSPEGSWRFNDVLSGKRSNEVLEYFKEYMSEEMGAVMRSAKIPENWEQLKVMVENDTILNCSEKVEIAGLIERMDDPDRTERLLSRHIRYRYIKEYLYPKLRSVSFDFHLHRVGMVKDTIHTTELDSVYMAGLEALKSLDYKTAVCLLGPYGDYNAALAYASLDRNYSALDVLKTQDLSNPKVCYLLAVVMSRLEHLEEAVRYYNRAKFGDPSLRHRANLDPELSNILNINSLN